MRPREVNSHRSGRAAPLLVAGLVAVACGSVHGEHGAAGAVSAGWVAASPVPGGTGSGWPVIRGTPVRRTIVIDAQVGETFASPPAWAKPKLDGVQAWDRSFLGGSRNGKPRPIPADVSYQLGMLTVPPSVTDLLAWGYSSPPGPCLAIGIPRVAGQPAPSPAPSAPKRCIEWTFIDASHPGNNFGTWQPLGRPQPSPRPPPGAAALRSGGFLDATLERYSPRRLVMQGPLSTIRWTFDNASCSIGLYWFWPPQLQRGPGRAACPWQHAFALNVVSDFTSRGHVFSVIAGYVAHRDGQLVRAILADGQTQIYDPEDADGAWLFAVQQCGNYPGTAFRAVEEISPAGAVIASLPIPAVSASKSGTGCRS